MTTFHKRIAGALGLAIGLSSGSVFADGCTTYTISAAPAEAIENTWMTFNVFRTGDASATVKATYQTVALTATSSADYTPVSGTLTFYPNETMKTVKVWIKPDAVTEAPETIQLVLNGTGTQPPVTNGVGVLVNTLVPSIPGVPSVPDLPDLPNLPSIPRPPNPCGSGPSCY